MPARGHLLFEEVILNMPMVKPIPITRRLEPPIHPTPISLPTKIIGQTLQSIILHILQMAKKTITIEAMITQTTIPIFQCLQPPIHLATRGRIHRKMQVSHHYILEMAKKTITMEAMMETITMETMMTKTTIPIFQCLQPNIHLATRGRIHRKMQVSHHYILEMAKKTITMEAMMVAKKAMMEMHTMMNSTFVKEMDQNMVMIQFAMTSGRSSLQPRT